jgi:acyl carrier protein
MGTQAITDFEGMIREFISENILYSNNGYPYSDDTSFLESGVIDSMGIMELVMFIEECFSIHIEDHEVVPDNFDSVTKVASFVQKKKD